MHAWWYAWPQEGSTPRLHVMGSMHMGHAGGVYRLIVEPFRKTKTEIQTVVRHQNVTSLFFAKPATKQRTARQNYPLLLGVVCAVVVPACLPGLDGGRVATGAESMW